MPELTVSRPIARLATLLFTTVAFAADPAAGIAPSQFRQGETREAIIQTGTIKEIESFEISGEAKGRVTFKIIDPVSREKLNKCDETKCNVLVSVDPGVKSGTFDLNYKKGSDTKRLGVSITIGSKVQSITPSSMQPGQTTRATIETGGEAGIQEIEVDGFASGLIRLAIVNDSGLPQPKCESTRCMVSVSVDPSTLPGTYELKYKKDGKSGKLGLRLIIASLARDGYIHCPHKNQPIGVNGPLAANAPGVQCQAGLLDPKETADIFGSRIARTYLVFQVRVENQREDLEYFLRSIRLSVGGRRAGGEPLSVPTRDRGLARGVSIKGQALDPRNLSLSIARAAGSVFGGIAALPIDGDLLGRVAGLFNGPMLDSVHRALPDFTVQQVSRLDDYALPRSGIVIPRRAPDTVVAFLPMRVFLSPEERDLIVSTKAKRTFGTLASKIKAADVRCQSEACKDISWVHDHIQIELAGSHFAEVHSGEPKLQRIVPSEVTRGAAAKITVFGSELHRATSLVISKTGGASVEVRLTGSAEERSFATGSLTKADSELLKDSEYNLALMGTDGRVYPSAVTFKVQDAPALPEPKLSPSSIGLGTKGILTIATGGRELKEVKMADGKLKFSGLKVVQAGAAYTINYEFAKDATAGATKVELTCSDGTKPEVPLTIEGLPTIMAFEDKDGKPLTEVEQNKDVDVELVFSAPVAVTVVEFAGGGKTVQAEITRRFSDSQRVRVKVKLEVNSTAKVKASDRGDYVVESKSELKVK